MGASTILAVGGSLLDSATGIYFDYNNKKQSESNLRISSALKQADLNQNIDYKNLQNRAKIVDLNFQNMNARDDFAKAELGSDIKNLSKINTIKAGYATAGVELKNSAIDYINAVEDSVNRERALRTSANENEIADRGRLASTLLYDIDRNNILRSYESEKIKLNQTISMEQLDNKFWQSTTSSIVSFGKKTSKLF